MAGARQKNIARFNRERPLKAGITTQLVVGAAGETDREILSLSSSLYQADFLLRSYGFSPEELPFLMPCLPSGIIASALPPYAGSGKFPGRSAHRGLRELTKMSGGKKKRVVVAMSGGVDSSCAAALLKEQDCEVIGVTMQIWPSDDLAATAKRFRGCCSLEAVEKARGVAAKLGILHYVMNFKRVFEEKVIGFFCREYAQGRTPNPCIRCNQFIKFDALLMRAKALDADFIATGHYARIEPNPLANRFFLRKGVDPKKDQSYVLYGMNQESLQHTLMPLGGHTKEEVRQMARQWGLPVADSPESQEICFIPDDNYAAFVQGRTKEASRPGSILDKKGRKLGEHRGILFYTVGQRRGLGISSPEPLYVVEIDRERNVLLVGRQKDVYADELVAEHINYISKEGLQGLTEIRARIRYNMREAPATVSPLSDGRVRVKFTKPQRAITPGQAVVFYQEDVVLGGGTIVCAASHGKKGGETDEGS